MNARKVSDSRKGKREQTQMQMQMQMQTARRTQKLCPFSSSRVQRTAATWPMTAWEAPLRLEIRTDDDKDDDILPYELLRAFEDCGRSRTSSPRLRVPSPPIPIENMGVPHHRSWFPASEHGSDLNGQRLLLTASATSSFDPLFTFEV